MPRFLTIALFHILVPCLGLGAGRSVTRTGLATHLAPEEGTAGAAASVGHDADDIVKADDGDQKERTKQLQDIRKKPLHEDIRVGEHVLGFFFDANYYPAVVESINSDGTYTLKWDDGDDRGRTKPLAELRKILKSTEVSLGDRVEGKYGNGKWYGATVERKNADGSYLLRWDDGDGNDRSKRLSDIRGTNPDPNAAAPPPPPPPPPAAEAPPPPPQSTASSLPARERWASIDETQSLMPSGAEKQSLTGSVAMTVFMTVLLALHF